MSYWSRKTKTEKAALISAISLGVINLVLLALDIAKIWVGASESFALILGAILILVAYLRRKGTKGYTLYFLICGILFVIVSVISWII